MVNFQGCTSTHNGGKQFVRHAIYNIYGRHFVFQNGGKKEKKIFLLISTISMGQHNNYFAKVCFLPFQSQDPSPPLMADLNSLEAPTKFVPWSALITFTVPLIQINLRRALMDELVLKSITVSR